MLQLSKESTRAKQQNPRHCSGTIQERLDGDTINFNGQDTKFLAPIDSICRAYNNACIPKHISTFSLPITAEVRAYLKNLPYDIVRSDLLWELKTLSVNHTGRIFLMKPQTKSPTYAQCSAFVWREGNEQVQMW